VCAALQSPSCPRQHEHECQSQEDTPMRHPNTEQTPFHCAAGTFTWTAPEILMGLRCTEKCDLFSFGVVLWEVITSETPQRGRLRSLE
jgi:serine/threonine protein kinase